MLNDDEIRASWEAERASMRTFLIEKKKFNPKAVDKMIGNFIASMVFSKIPCTTRAGIVGAFNAWSPR